MSDNNEEIKIEEKEDDNKQDDEIKEESNKNNKEKKSVDHLEVNDDEDLEDEDYNSLFGDDDDININLKADTGSNEDFDDKKVQQQNLKRIQKRNSSKKNTSSSSTKKSTKKRKRKNKEDDLQLPQEEKKKSDFDLILEENIKKPSRRTNKKILESERGIHEEFARKLIEEMELAYQNDVLSLKQKKPALEKLKLLPKIEEMMRKTYMQDVLLSQSILMIFNKWLLSPKKGVLPSLEIRSKLLELMNIISISKWDNQHELIKHSQIGRIIKSFINHPKETHLNKQLAQQLIDKWTRSIVNDSDHGDYNHQNYPSPTKINETSVSKKQKMLQLLEKKLKETDNTKTKSIYREIEKAPIFFVKGPPPPSKVESKRKKKDTSINLETTN